MQAKREADTYAAALDDADPRSASSVTTTSQVHLHCLVLDKGKAEDVGNYTPARPGTPPWATSLGCARRGMVLVKILSRRNCSASIRDLIDSIDDANSTRLL